MSGATPYGAFHGDSARTASECGPGGKGPVRDWGGGAGANLTGG